jgi:hypothetical protein
MLRGLIVVLALVETSIFLLAYLGQTESGGFRIMAEIAALAAVPFLLGVLPALVLALMNRALRMSAALSIGVLLLAVYIWPRL